MEDRTITVFWTKVQENAKEPTRAYSGDAGWDLYTCGWCELAPGEIRNISTGIAIQLPSSTEEFFYEAQIRPRSGHRLKGILVTLGTIDSGYRGEIGAIVYNFSDKYHTINSGEKICQLIVNRIPRVRFVLAPSLSPSERGEKGFGSSGL